MPAARFKKAKIRGVLHPASGISIKYPGFL